MQAKEKIDLIQKELHPGVRLVAVSKTKPVEEIMEYYNAGHRIFGENKVQEITAKNEKLPHDIQWHYIGHLQRNKVKAIVPFVELIHGVDSMRLLAEINKQAQKINRKINCLLQFHIASEDTKFGLDWEEGIELLSSEDFKKMHHINICGVMGMASYSDDLNLVRNEFRTLKNYSDKLKEIYFRDQEQFKEISMGMSGDYKIAMEEGSTLVRVGSLIFGSRNYTP